MNHKNHSPPYSDDQSMVDQFFTHTDKWNKWSSGFFSLTKINAHFKN